jgi:diguanylate cyclase (GGDEF)-like protein/PAS domain S-box-containing protein
MSEQTLRTVISSTSEGFWLVHPETLVTLKVNNALCTMLGYTRDEMVGKNMLSFADDRNQQVIWKQLSLIESSPHHLNYEAILKTKTGKDIHTLFNTTTLRDPVTNHITMVFSFVRNITEHKRYEAELYHQANIDPTTGIPNRNCLIKHINNAVHAENALGVLLLDLDNFKIVNNTMGHAAGDRLLAAIAYRLEEASTTENGLVARAGGDEFVIVIKQDPSLTILAFQQHLLNLAQHLLEQISKPIHIDGSDVTIFASVGIATSPVHGPNANHLMKNADIAVYQAKENGKGSIQFYSDTMDIQVRKKLDISNRLRGALERNEFQLHYQPQCHATTGEIVGVEALLRWCNQGENLSPSDFVPLLEETGLIISVGRWVLETACSQAAAWHRAGHKLRISINISARQIQTGGLTRLVKEILENNPDLPANSVRLEITESLLIDTIGHTAKRIRKMTDLGVSFSLDDFGTGYSSLSYIHELPITEIKIDRAFVNRLQDNKSSAALVKTIVAMAQSFQAETVAEGVETREQLNILAEIGVDLVQGYLFGKPMPAEDLDAMLESTSRSYQEGSPK